MADQMDGVIAGAGFRPTSDLRHPIRRTVKENDLDTGLHIVGEDPPIGSFAVDEHNLLAAIVDRRIGIAKGLRPRIGGRGGHIGCSRRFSPASILRCVTFGKGRIGVEVRLNHRRGVDCRCHAGGVEHEARFQRHRECGGRRSARLAGAAVSTNALRTVYARHRPSPRRSPHRPSLPRRRLTISVGWRGRYHFFTSRHNDPCPHSCKILVAFCPIRVLS